MRSKSLWRHRSQRRKDPLDLGRAMINHFIYCRKSTEEEERQILSIEAQLTELRQFSRQNGVLVGKEFVETRTAKEPVRPIFNAMLDEIEAGDAAGILAWN